jgi:hypothetical protein
MNKFFEHLPGGWGSLLLCIYGWIDRLKSILADKQIDRMEKGTIPKLRKSETEKPRFNRLG